MRVSRAAAFLSPATIFDSQPWTLDPMKQNEKKKGEESGK